MGIELSLFLIACFCLVFSSLDVSLPLEKLDMVKKSVLQYKHVKGVNFIKNRRVGQGVWLDIEVLIDPKINVKQGYSITREIRLALIRKYKHIKDVSITFSCKENLKLSKRPLRPVKKIFQPV